GDKAHSRILQGKAAMAIITTGHEQEAYQKGGFNNYPLEDFIRPLEQMSILCGMKYYPPLTLHQAHKATTEELIAFSDSYKQRMDQLTQLPSFNNE
ncbi:MAG: NAD(P)H-dependent oxidoreductase, partial [Pseudomonadota bacterium]